MHTRVQEGLARAEQALDDAAAARKRERNAASESAVDGAGVPCVVSSAIGGSGDASSRNADPTRNTPAAA